MEPTAQTRIVDSYQYAALVVSRVVSDGYIHMVKTIPQLYRYIYERAERTTEIGRFRTWAHQFTAANLRALIEQMRPDAVVCTHAFPCGAMAEYKRLFSDAPPVVAIVTDFALHGFWIHEGIDAYCVATQQMRDALIARGVQPARVYLSGIPVRRDFVTPTQRREELRERLGLPTDRNIVLLMGGGLGIAPIEHMLCAIDDARTSLSVVVITGRNTRVRRRLVQTAERVNYPVRAFGFVENVYDYMHAADVLVTKPGGLTTAEALVAKVPMVLCKPLPGQEERNAQLLLESGAALRARTIRDLPAMLDRVLANDSQRDRMVAAACRMARPNAAGEAAAMIAGLIHLRKEVVA